MNGNEQRVDGRTFWWFDFQKVSTLLDFADSDCCWVKRCWSSSESIHTQTKLELTLNRSDEARVNTTSSYQRHLLHNQRSGDEMLALISKWKSNSRLKEWCDEMSDHAEQRSEMWKQKNMRNLSSSSLNELFAFNHYNLSSAESWNQKDFLGFREMEWNEKENELDEWRRGGREMS